MTFAEVALDVLGAIEAIVSAPTVATIVAELVTVASQLATPGQQQEFMRRFVTWAAGFPPCLETDTDEARAAAQRITAALNQIADNVRQGAPEA